MEIVSFLLGVNIWLVNHGWLFALITLIFSQIIYHFIPAESKVKGDRKRLSMWLFNKTITYWLIIIGFIMVLQISLHKYILFSQ